MNPGILVLPNMVQGDQWDGVVISNLLVDGETPTVPLSRVEMSFTAYPLAGPTVVLYSPGDITIVDPDTWEVTVPSQYLNLPQGTYNYGISFYDENNNRKTYLTGTLTVL